jgi:GMP synthase (glutamine-hydrolysing)
MRKDNLKILLLQIRNQPQVREEEFASFVAYSGLPAKQIDILNVFDTPKFDAAVLTGYDALFVGGASEASVLEPLEYPFVDSCIALLRHCVNNSVPVFASCFGFQLAILALGETIIRDKTDYEMGTLPIQLTELAGNDPVFAGMKSGFPAVSVHKERATELPDGCELLAYTESCIHSFRVCEKPFWAFQFHPEVDRDTLVQRLTLFKSQYTDGDDHLDKVLAEAVETPESNQLVRRFVEHVLLKDAVSRQQTS